MYAGSIQAWLFGFDRHSGELLWRRLLATGADLVQGTDRFATGSVPRLSAQPLAASDGLVFAGTHLGAAALLDGLDGRPLWSVKCRRRSAQQPGWPGGRPSWSPANPGAVLWAPFDSDHLYTLSTDLEALDGGLPFVEPPLPLGESVTLLGGEPGVGPPRRPGRRATVTRIEPSNCAPSSRRDWPRWRESPTTRWPTIAWRLSTIN